MSQLTVAGVHIGATLVYGAQNHSACQFACGYKGHFSEYSALNHKACHTYPVLWVDLGTIWIYSTLNHSTSHTYPLLVDIGATLLFGALNHSAWYLRMVCCIGSGLGAV